MTKFIRDKIGQYLNINEIRLFTITEDDSGWVVVFYEKKDDIPCVLMDDLLTAEEAQEWLDKFMQKHGLILEPITASRCF